MRGKFKVADADGDGRLNRKEFGQFLHPSDPSMVEWMLEDHLKTYDVDKDGAISLDEYMCESQLLYNNFDIVCSAPGILLIPDQLLP